MTPPANRRSRGFTLIELMVVLVIIGVLAALIVPNVLDRTDDARATAARTDVNNLVQALKLYKLDNQRYPSADQGLEALVKKPSAGVVPPNWKPYLEKLPQDPWGKPYQYLNPGLNGEIDVFSFGPDGQAGGEATNSRKPQKTALPATAAQTANAHQRANMRRLSSGPLDDRPSTGPARPPCPYRSACPPRPPRARCAAASR